MEHVSSHVVVTGCVDLLNLAPTRVQWDRCVLAQCEINPDRASSMVMKAPFQLQQRLKNLCPPRPKPPAASQAPAPAP
jgi:hypothetical protein